MSTAKVYPDALETCKNGLKKDILICFFTSRVESHRDVTEKWLKNTDLSITAYLWVN